MCCEKCGQELRVGEWPFCPHGIGHNSVIGDEIDITVKHALCHEDGTPRRFTSRQEWIRAQKESGMSNHVEHIPEKGSDKSRHTSRWI